jgi:hypothetical protein
VRVITPDLPPEPGVPITWGGTVLVEGGTHHMFVDVCCYTPSTIMHDQVEQYPIVTFQYS